MIFSTNYMQSLAGVPHSPITAIQDNNNHLIIIINLLFNKQGKGSFKGGHKDSAENINIIVRPTRWTTLAPSRI